MVVTNAFSASAWVRLSSAHFEIYTDAGERTGVEILRRFETARRVFSPKDSVPVRVFAFANSKDYEELRPAATVIGFYQSGPDRDYIAMELRATEASRVVLHEYTHLILNHNSAALPQWLEEGLAEFYSTMTTSSGRIRLGAPVRPHLQRLREETWLPASALAAVDKNSPSYNEAEMNGLFYAQSWALAHMLYVSPRYAGRLDVFSAALAAGQSQESAFFSAYGKSMEKVMADLRTYLDKPLPWAEVDGSTDLEGMAIERHALSEGEEAEARADLALASGRLPAARRLLERAAVRHPDSREVLSGLAMLAMREKRMDDARRYFERAIEADANDGRTLFEYAMLLRDTAGDRDRVTEYMEKAVKASPDLAEAHFLLGVRKSDEGRFDASVEHLRRATELLPRQAYFWHALAYSYHKLGNAARSREAAYRARNAARSEQETKMAEAALRLSDPGVQAPQKPPVTTPSSWENLKGDAKVEGRLNRVDCGETPRLFVAGMVLEARQPNRIVLSGVGGAKAELRCGPQDISVMVEYVAATKEVTAIEFR